MQRRKNLNSKRFLPRFPQIWDSTHTYNVLSAIVDKGGILKMQEKSAKTCWIS